MKASRAVARTMKSMATTEERLGAIEEQLQRIEDLLIELHAHGLVSPEELADVLVDPEPVQTTKDQHAEAFAVAAGRKPPPKGAKRG